MRRCRPHQDHAPLHLTCRLNSSSCSIHRYSAKGSSSGLNWLLSMTSLPEVRLWVVVPKLGSFMSTGPGVGVCGRWRPLSCVQQTLMTWSWPAPPRKLKKTRRLPRYHAAPRSHRSVDKFTERRQRCGRRRFEELNYLRRLFDRRQKTEARSVMAARPLFVYMTRVTLH